MKRFLLPFFALTSCSNPYVVDARGPVVEEGSPPWIFESYDDSDTDEYLEKPMVHEIDVSGVDSGVKDNNMDRDMDAPDSYDKSLFESPALSCDEKWMVDEPYVSEHNEYTTK